MTDIKVKTVSLDTCDKSILKDIFKVSFPDQFAKSCPFPNDPVFIAYKGDKPMGFCMVHDVAPYPFPTGSGVYMYNLCVLPKARKHGIATALLDHLKHRYKSIHAHMLTTEQYHGWLQKRGFVKGNTWRSKYYEYTYSSTPIDKKDKPEVSTQSPFVNYEENIVYLE